MKTFADYLEESANPSLDAEYHKKMAAKAAAEGKSYNPSLEDAAQAAAKKKAMAEKK